MIDIELLIHEIEKEECLWKTSNKDYMDKHIKQKSWINVASVIFSTWSTFSEKEQEARGEFFLNLYIN